MNLFSLIITLTLPLVSLAQNNKWVELKMDIKKSSSNPKERFDASKKVYIPSDLLKELIEQGRVITKDDESSMNCGGSDCTFGAQ